MSSSNSNFSNLEKNDASSSEKSSTPTSPSQSIVEINFGSRIQVTEDSQRLIVFFGHGSLARQLVNIKHADIDFKAIQKLSVPQSETEENILNFITNLIVNLVIGESKDKKITMDKEINLVYVGDVNIGRPGQPFREFLVTQELEQKLAKQLKDGAEGLKVIITTKILYSLNEDIIEAAKKYCIDNNIEMEKIVLICTGEGRAASPLFKNAMLQPVQNEEIDPDNGSPFSLRRKS